MSNAMKAADDIKSLASRFRSVLEVAEVLEKIGSLEQAVRDAESKKKAAYADAEKAVSLLNDKAEELEKANAEIGKAKEASASIVAQANQKAGVIIAEAEVKAGEIISKANSDKAVVEEAIKSLNAKSVSLSGEISKQESHLADIKKHIQDAKSKISGI